MACKWISSSYKFTIQITVLAALMLNPHSKCTFVHLLWLQTALLKTNHLTFCHFSRWTTKGNHSYSWSSQNSHSAAACSHRNSLLWHQPGTELIRIYREFWALTWTKVCSGLSLLKSLYFVHYSHTWSYVSIHSRIFECSTALFTIVLDCG